MLLVIEDSADCGGPLTVELENWVDGESLFPDGNLGFSGISLAGLECAVLFEAELPDGGLFLSATGCFLTILGDCITPDFFGVVGDDLVCDVGDRLEVEEFEARFSVLIGSLPAWDSSTSVGGPSSFAVFMPNSSWLLRSIANIALPRSRNSSSISISASTRTLLSLMHTRKSVIALEYCPMASSKAPRLTFFLRTHSEGRR